MQVDFKVRTYTWSGQDQIFPFKVSRSVCSIVMPLNLLIVLQQTEAIQGLVVGADSELDLKGLLIEIMLN